MTEKDYRCQNCGILMGWEQCQVRDRTTGKMLLLCADCAMKRLSERDKEQTQPRPTVRKSRDVEPQVFKRSGPTYVKVIDAAKGIVESIVSVYGVTDLYNDVMTKGVFGKSLKERGPKIRVLDAHDTMSTLSVIGVPLELKEVTRAKLPPELLEQFPDATGGLYAKTQFLLNTERGREVFARIEAGAIDEWSIGFDIIQASFRDTDDDDEPALPVRDINEARLWEYSPVIWGANPATATLEARALRRQEIQQQMATDAVPAMQTYALAPRTRAWDAASAVQRWRSASGSDDEPSGRYRNGFMYYDAESTDQFTAYKLPYVDVIDGKPHAVPRGLFAIAGRLDGTDIPDSDKAVIRRRLSAWYARMRDEFDDPSIVPPWEQSAPDDHELLTAIAHTANLLDELLSVGQWLTELRRLLTHTLHISGNGRAPGDTRTLEQLTPDELDILLDALLCEMQLRGMIAELTPETAEPLDDESQALTDDNDDSADPDAGPHDDNDDAPTPDAALTEQEKRARIERLHKMGTKEGSKHA